MVPGVKRKGSQEATAIGSLMNQTFGSVPFAGGPSFWGRLG